MIASPRSLRARLMLLVLVASIPAFAVIGYSTWWMRDHEDQRGRQALLDLARALAERHRENLDEARLLLVNLARMPEIRAGQGRACQESLAEIRALTHAHVANLFVVLPKGDVRCSARDPGRQFNTADMPWFQGALATTGFRVGEYHISRRSGAPALVLTHTLREGNAVVSVLAVALDLSWLATRPYLTGQSPAMAYALFDQGGNLLLRHPVNGAIGTNIADQPFWRTLSGLREAALFSSRGGDGVERQFAYAPLGPVTQPYARLVVGIPPAALDASARELFLIGMTGLASALILGLLAGWFGGAALVIRPLRPVLETVRRMADGDLSARAAPETPRGDEISRLAREVDRMAEALSRRDQALIEARDRAQAYLDVVGVMVLALNAKGNIALANRKASQVLGCDANRPCLGDNWFERWIPEADRAQARIRFDQAMAGEEDMAEAHEHRILTRGGQQRLITWHVSPLCDRDGQSIGLLCAGEDITEIRRTQEALLDSGNRYKTLVENIPGVVYLCAPEYPWPMEFISSAVEELTGIAATRFLDHSARYGELVHPDDLEELERSVARGIAERRPYSCTYRIHHQDGDWRWVRERGQATYDAAGQPLRLDGIIMDITEQQLLRQEQERLQGQLQQAQKMEALGQLTGGIAHDFNNILASVLGFTRLALRRHVQDQDGELAEYLREVVTAGERARDLVARMLAFSRSQPGRAPHPLPPGPLIREAIKMLAATIPASIHIETRVEEALPDIAMDPVDLHQILVNLVINARDAMSATGRITIGLARVHCEARACATCHESFTGDYLELTVADDGQGIAQEVLPRIFEPFFTTKAVGEGSGMGLAMVHGLAHRAGGHVTVTSSVGVGSMFHVHLPLATAPEPHALLTPPSLSATGDARGRVLLVDDEAALLRLVKTGLEAAGWRVDAHVDPRRALAAFRASPEEFDAVISDQAMPGMTGLELIDAVHASRPRLPAILCTGYRDGLGEALARRADPPRVFEKPGDRKSVG